MARYQIIIAYDGTRFAGSQRQAHASTVQSELEAALSRLGWRGSSILLAGRTDSGVHAAGQVAAADLEWLHTPEELRSALNSGLPADVAVQLVLIAPPKFHPRFDATSRRYRYRLFFQSVRDPLRERYAWRIAQGLDDRLLEEASRMLMGRHDFSAFGSSPRKGGSTVRTVLLAQWSSQGEERIFEVQADAFLYRMVRRMVYVQVAAAQGRLALDKLGEALLTRKDLPAGLAPACGLTLMDVTYPSFDDLEKIKD